MVTADELACRTCSATLSRPMATYPKTTEDLVNRQWQETVWGITQRYCKKCRRRQAALPVPWPTLDGFPNRWLNTGTIISVLLKI